ncbi:MAG: hypothetical protein ACLVJH_19290 [Faecalibacterium prausnitzii]
MPCTREAETAFLGAPPPKKAGLDESAIAYPEAQHIPHGGGFLSSDGIHPAAPQHPTGNIDQPLQGTLISGEQFTSSKPDPEIFLTAAKALGISPGRNAGAGGQLPQRRAGRCPGRLCHRGWCRTLPRRRRDAPPVHRRVQRPAQRWQRCWRRGKLLSEA